MKLGPVIYSNTGSIFRIVIDNENKFMEKCVKTVTFEEIEAQQRASFIMNGTVSLAPKIYEIINEENSVCILMDYVEGITINEYLRRKNITSNDKVPDLLKKKLF